MAALCAFMAWAGGVRAELPEAVAQALAQAGIPDTHVGIVVQSVDGTPLLQHGAERALNPASVMKLLTTLAALDTWGPAHTFQTRVWLEGPVQDGVLEGNLVLQGGGDPGMTPERFWWLLREVRQRGIREIRGDLVLDNRFYGIEPVDPGAFDQSPLRPYNAPPAALLVNYNLQLLRLEPRPEGVGARLDPGAAAQRLVNRLQVGAGPCNGWQDRVIPRLEGAQLVLEGEYPGQCTAQTLALNLDPPPATVAAWFGQLWQELGGRPPVLAREGAPGPDARLLLSVDSPPLSALVRDVNKFSNNVMAKMLFLNLGAARFGAPATWEKGERALRAWLSGHGLKLSKLVVQNGSGLSRIERLAAADMARLLAWAATRPAYYEFAAALPAVGLEGTQRRRFNGQGGNGQDFSGLAWLKSGSLNRVRNLAGYLLGPGGERRILVFFINHAQAGQARAAQEALLSWAAAYLKSPLPGASGE